MLDIRAAFGSAAQMKNLKGGHGDGCNFEAEDALAKLEKLGALKKADQNWFPLPMEEIAEEIKKREGIN